MSHLQNHTVSAHSLQIFLLGAFSLRVENAPVSIATRKTQSLLAFLALYPEAHSREKLAAMFWGDSADRDARHSLRSALNVLRKALGADFLLADRDTVQLNPDERVWVDAREFKNVEHETSLVNLEALVTRYRGELLSDFYDEWIFPERAFFRALYLETLLRLAREMRAQNETARAIEYAQTVLKTDPAHEPAYQELMLCHTARGDRAAAVRAYQDCVRALRQELNVAPSVETTSILEWIRTRRETNLSWQQLVSNLPNPLSSFIGREQELRDISRLAGTARLLTLTGTGGSGKTRLAIQSVRHLLGDVSARALFPDGAWWIELAPLMDATLVPQTIANTLGLRETPYQTLMESLLHHLQNKQLLLILDNCEHLIDACARVADLLLTQCPNLHILATSREPFALTGETIYQVSPLTLPAETETIPGPEVAENESVRLFFERARAVKTDFALTPDTLPAVIQICRRLDGIPLAIELAAARIKHLSVEQIAERLHDRFGLLTGGSRAALPRHQTLRATIDWSYQLLTPDARRLFKNLSVFASAFTLEAAQGVCTQDTFHENDVLAYLSQLVDRSLLLAESREGSSVYRMLEMIRQYGLEKLLESGDVERVRTHYLEFFLNWAEQAEPLLKQPTRTAWLARLDADSDNLRAALEWSQNENVEPVLGLRLAGALYELWLHQGYLREGTRWLDAALSRMAFAFAQPSSANVVPLAKGHYALGRLVHELGNNVGAEPILESSLQFWQQTIPLDKTGLANTLVALGWVRRHRGDLESARALQLQAITLFRETDDRAGLADALIEFGLVLREQEDFVNARLAAEESEAIFRELDYERGVASALGALGLILRREGDYTTAIPVFEQSLAIFRGLGERPRIPYMLHNLATLKLDLGEVARASELNQQAEILFRELGNQDGIVHCLYLNGLVAMFQDDVSAAATHFRHAMQLVRDGAAVGWLRGGCLFGLAMIAAAQNRHERAARLWGATEKQRIIAASYWAAAEQQLYARTLAEAEERLGKTMFEKLGAEGAAWSFGQAIESALDEGASV